MKVRVEGRLCWSCGWRRVGQGGGGRRSGVLRRPTTTRPGEGHRPASPALNPRSLLTSPHMLRRTGGLAACAVLVSALVLGSGPAASAHEDGKAAAKHVLLVLVDGLHQSDLAWYVKQ